MKRILTIGRIHKGKRAQVVSLQSMREMMFAEAARETTGAGRLKVRQLDRIHAVTGIPWARINEEAKKEGL